MRMLMKSLLTVSAVLSLAPTAALAYPPQCFEICDKVGCGEECSIGPRTWTTCGEYAPTWCQGLEDPTDASASVTVEDAAQADDASRVCGEETQATRAEG